MADELVNEFQCPEPIVIAQDLSKPNAAQELFDQTEGLGVQVNYLVNNAGMGEWGLFSESPLEKDETMIIA